MGILVINCGSSSVKFQFFEKDGNTCLIKGEIERFGLPGSRLTYQKPFSAVCSETVKVHPVRKGHRVKATGFSNGVSNYDQAIEIIAAVMANPRCGVIKHKNEIKAIGHRVVHGADKFKDAVIINGKVLKEIKQCFDLAPLHNPPAYFGIKACAKIFPRVPQVAVFDTAFHQGMPAFAYIYALPYSYYQQYRIRRYGFHGTSHRYVAEAAARQLRRPLKQLRLITAHLGNGCSITAIKQGRVLDTSMGFTPLEGLVMGTRCGDIDAAAVLFLMRKQRLSPRACEEILNKKSGLLGISGRSSDMRDIVRLMEKKSARAGLAWEMFVYRLKKYIGAYCAAMNGVDALVWTGGIGENSSLLRRVIKKDLSFLLKNAKILVIPTNEELLIAADTRRLVFGCFHED